MKVLIVNQAQVHELLPIDECMEAMVHTLTELADGKALNPLRQTLPLPGKRGLLGLMPGYLEGLNALGLKVVSVFDNKGTEHDSHQGAVLVFEAEHGCLNAIVDASAEDDEAVLRVMEGDVLDGAGQRLAHASMLRDMLRERLPSPPACE